MKDNVFYGIIILTLVAMAFVFGLRTCAAYDYHACLLKNTAADCKDMQP